MVLSFIEVPTAVLHEDVLDVPGRREGGEGDVG